jgi:hydroxymethylglutaryl-CoA synthase
MAGSGIVAYGSYVPYWRLTSATVAAALGKRASAASRAVASYDQDTTTLAVEAARAALRGAPAGTADAIDALAFATASPVYADKTNATAVHAALGLPAGVRASDAGASTRGGIAALIGALRSRETTLVAISDRNTGPAGSASEAYGDAAAAFVAGEADDVVAEFLGAGSVSAEFEDRWRAAGEPWSSYWEERFAETIYARLGEESFTAAVKNAGLTPADISHLAITGVSPRAAARVGKATGVDRSRIADDLSASVGFSGAAHPGLLLCHLLDIAEPGEVIAVVSLVDGRPGPGGTSFRIVGHGAGQRGQPGARLSRLPGLDRPGPAADAAPARACPGGGAAGEPASRLEICLPGQCLPPVRYPASATAGRLPALRRGERHGSCSAGGRHRDDRDLHP